MELSATYSVLAIVGVVVLVWSQSNRFRVPYPPGPPADPIIGHLRVMPQSNQDVAFREMAKKYGDIMYFHFPGRSFLVLSSLKIATEILEQRSRIYSDRIKLPLFELMGWTTSLALLPYGKRYQKHRRMANEYLNEKQCISYWPQQTQSARRLIVKLASSSSEDWMKHLYRFSAEVIIKITYGRDLVENDPFLDLCQKAVQTSTSCGRPGGTPVDFLPFLRHFPSWFPGTYYAYKARSFFPVVQKMHKYPFEAVKRQMSEGTAQPSYVAYHLEQLHGKIPDDEYIEDIQGSASQLFGAGAETTATTLSHFVLAMVLFPDIQRKAQKELDNVMGKSRLPELGDRESLPYVEAILNEVHRWNSTVPLGVPHRSTEDDVYNGMYIPKGTVVIANAYAILRDERMYADPDTFNPSRYLPKPEGNGEPYPMGHFGFGRRICVGQYLADASLFIAIASILATLKIDRAKDANGRDIIPKLEFVAGATSQPKPFPCVIKPRDEVSKNLLQQTQLWNEFEISS